MRKIRLDVEALDVQTFVLGDGGDHGTVRANEDTSESQETVGTCCGCQSLGCLDTDPNQQGGGTGYTACVNTCYVACTLAGTCHGATCDYTCEGLTCPWIGTCNKHTCYPGCVI